RLANLQPAFRLSMSWTIIVPECAMNLFSLIEEEQNYLTSRLVTSKEQTGTESLPSGVIKTCRCPLKNYRDPMVKA
ncbi:MAG: hypothetical protein ACFFB3_24290, partial [Candidatus Hodarchaeota archaeon]